MTASDTREVSEVEWPDDAVHNRLIGDWHIYQRRGGHRTSTDDLITAWLATQIAVRPVSRYLDLGCGIGSVMLMVAHALRPQETVGVEAQPQSVLLARRALEELGEPSIQVRHGDLRALEKLDELGRFPLVTGSPPYFPIGTGVLPADPQRRACRFEVRGGVEVYCAAAAQTLADDGVFVLVFQTVWDERVQAAASAHGLAMFRRADFLMREGRDAPFLTVYAFRRGRDRGPVQREVITVRTAEGELTPGYQKLRDELGGLGR